MCTLSLARELRFSTLHTHYGPGRGQATIANRRRVWERLRAEGPEEMMLIAATSARAVFGLGLLYYSLEIVLSCRCVRCPTGTKPTVDESEPASL
jgi:hypothetical protein